ncbi:MAG: HEPN domain-containing protein [Candidatus Kariarchaeaceae archaeon]
MVERSKDWLKQSIRDLTIAKKLTDDGYFEWACFIAQQSAEKALKAYFQKKGIDAWGHTLIKFCQDIEEEDSSISQFMDDARLLDKLYIQTRYPNGFSSGSPMDFYSKNDADQAIQSSERLIDWVKEKI